MLLRWFDVIEACSARSLHCMPFTLENSQSSTAEKRWSGDDLTGGIFRWPSTGGGVGQSDGGMDRAASNGAVVFSRSQREYAVYDGQRTFGRWPLTEEGHRYAVEAYEAHAQSMHMDWPTRRRLPDPGRLGLPTDPIMKSVTYASPMSFVGSTRRILAWSTKTESRSGGTAVLVWTAVIWLCSHVVDSGGLYVVIFGSSASS